MAIATVTRVESEENFQGGPLTWLVSWHRLLLRSSAKSDNLSVYMWPSHLVVSEEEGHLHGLASCRMSIVRAFYDSSRNEMVSLVTFSVG